MSSPLSKVIESLIFISQDPITTEKIGSILEGTETEEIQAALDELVRKYESPDFGIQVRRLGGGYAFTTKPEHDGPVRRFLQIDRKNKLSTASLETLSIIAYHQPVTQSEISALRGVDSYYSVRSLLEKKLIKITGRRKAPGSPLIYRTSEKFLQYFDLNNLDELPSEQEIARILEEDKANEG